jgi:hypothetical protein
VAEQVALTALCSPAPLDDQILLPVGTNVPSAKRLLVTANRKSKLMQGGLRADHGEGACVTASTLAFFGGAGAVVSYRGLGFWQLIWRDGGLRLQLLISLVTLIGAVITAYNTYLKSTGKDAATFTSKTALTALVVAFVLAVLKFIQDYRKL